MEAASEWRFVHLSEYPESLNLFDKDLISMLNHTKKEVELLVGNMVNKSEMRSEELPLEFMTSTTGEIADEVHEWPNATLGPEFHHLVLQFRNKRLVGFRWNFKKTVTTQSNPWWRFW